MKEDIKSQAFTGVGWSAVERFSFQGITFLVQIILARILSPTDYGMIGMLAIFLQVAQVLIDSGFANALIQKKECTETDYSTVFYYNLAISVGLYMLLFIAAPFIEHFYSMPSLGVVTRVLSLTIIINSLAIVHRTILTKNIDFRSLTRISIIGAVISGAVGIICAIHGYGVWALVFQQILNSIIIVLLLFVKLNWVPKFLFDKSSFKSLFSFGSKLMISSLINTIYRNLYSLIIGKKFSAEELGYYTRAEQFAIFPSSNIGSIITRVAYPILSKVQDDNAKLRSGYRQIIQLSSFIIFPLMFGLMAIAKPFIFVFLTEKWSGAIVILQILCLDWMLDHISLLNLNLLYVKGRSDLALRLEIIKKSIAITIFIISIRWGVIGICWGRVLYSVIATIMNTYYTNKLIDLSFICQMRDILPYLGASALMAVIVYSSTFLFSTPLLQLIFGILIGIAVFTLISILFFKNTIRTILNYCHRK